ncbi:hypothetical protein WSM22_40880 [Cytophagales bacterium WSM2-2]|nr:hypothetical protein WSM22_40880 [Cytophagales bacterium WSM2-2]
MKAGDVFKNPATGEFGYIRTAPTVSNEQLLVVDLRVRPGGAVLGEHYHPVIKERFTVISGSIGFKLDGVKGIAKAGETLDIPAGVVHDWWNSGNEEARVIVQVKPGDRFADMAVTSFGLAVEGKTNKKGMPGFLQMAVLAKEFTDVMRLTKPPVWIQDILFSILAPLGRLMGYRASYAHHQLGAETTAIESFPAGLRVEKLV